MRHVLEVSGVNGVRMVANMNDDLSAATARLPDRAAKYSWKEHELIDIPEPLAHPGAPRTQCAEHRLRGKQGHVVSAMDQFAMKSRRETQHALLPVRRVVAHENQLRMYA